MNNKILEGSAASEIPPMQKFNTKQEAQESTKGLCPGSDWTNSYYQYHMSYQEHSNNEQIQTDVIKPREVSTAKC